MINPATARVWAVCDEEAATAPEEEDVPEAGEVAAPEAGEVPAPEAGEVAGAVGKVTRLGAGEAVPLRIKRPMRAATRIPVSTPHSTKARRHARNRTWRRSFCCGPSKPALPEWCASLPLVIVIAEPARLLNRMALKPCMRWSGLALESASGRDYA
jgi:hypothetical protein